VMQPEAAGSSHEFPGSGQEIMILFQCDRNDAVKAETSKCYKKNVIVTYCACFYEKISLLFYKREWYETHRGYHLPTARENHKIQKMGSIFVHRIG